MDKKIKRETSIPEVTNSSAMVKPKNLYDLILNLAATSSSQILYEVDSDSMEIDG